MTLTPLHHHSIQPRFSGVYRINIKETSVQLLSRLASIPSPSLSDCCPTESPTLRGRVVRASRTGCPVPYTLVCLIIQRRTIKLKLKKQREDIYAPNFQLIPDTIPTWFSNTSKMTCRPNIHSNVCLLVYFTLLENHTY